MTLTVRPLECGWLTSDFGIMVSGCSGPFRMPVAAFVVEHPRGAVVFDTGMHASLVDSTDRLRATAEFFDVELTPKDRLSARLSEAGIDPATIEVAILSHLHWDHAGGVHELPNARLVVQRSEWDAAHDAAAIDFGGYNPDDFELGHDRQLLDDDLDVFGDGALRVLRTPGHTAGHQSLLVGGRMLLVGDACYCRLALDSDALPLVGSDLDRQRATFAALRAHEAAGATLVFSHDPDQWATLPRTIKLTP